MSVHHIYMYFYWNSRYSCRYSLLPALASTGIIYAKVIEGSFTALRFYAFIEALLTQMQPFPAPKSVIVMDNARIHKDPRVLDLITCRYADFCLDFTVLLIILQWHALFFPSTIFTWLQPHWTWVFLYQVFCSTRGWNSKTGPSPWYRWYLCIFTSHSSNIFHN